MDSGRDNRSGNPGNQSSTISHSCVAVATPRTGDTVGCDGVLFLWRRRFGHWCVMPSEYVMIEGGPCRCGRGTLYDVLQVSPWCEPDVIQAAYRALARTRHPDVNRD